MSLVKKLTLAKYCLDFWDNGNGMKGFIFV